jgi:hypothetical protein
MTFIRVSVTQGVTADFDFGSFSWVSFPARRLLRLLFSL